MIFNLRYRQGVTKDGAPIPPKQMLRDVGSRAPIILMPTNSGTAVHGEALVDTGAAITCVDEQAARQAGLTVIGSGKVSSATHSNESVPIFAGKMEMTGVGQINLRQAYGVNIKDQGIVALIGRDLLEAMILIYNGSEGTFSLAS